MYIATSVRLRELRTAIAQARHWLAVLPAILVGTSTLTYPMEF